MAPLHSQEETMRINAILRAFVWGRWLLVALGITVLSLNYAPWAGTKTGYGIIVWGGIIVGAYAALNLGAQIILAFTRSQRRFLVPVLLGFIFTIDLLFFSFGLWATGGIESPVFILYFISIIIAALLFKTAGILLVGCGGILIYTGLIIAEFQGFIPHRSASALFSGIFEDVAATKTLASIVNSGFIAVTLLAASISRQIRIREREIARQREYLEKMIENLSDGLIFFDIKCRVVSLNPRAEKLLRISADFIQGKAFDLTLFVSGGEEEKKKVKESLAKYNAPFTFALTGGVETIIEALCIRLADSGGREFGSMIVLHDVTREHMMARTKDEFISIAAHQLRTPLSAIKWTMESVLSGEMGDLKNDQRHFLERASASNERMIQLVNDLLDIARIEEGRFGYKMKNDSLEALVQDILNSESMKVEARHITLKKEFPSRLLPPFLFDREKLFLAIENIIDNALSYSSEGGIVTVRIESGGGKAMISVADNGIGIPKHQISRLFTKFFRADNALKVKTEGTGLGLYLARNIILHHGGDITVASNEGEGSVFTLTIPMRIGIDQDSGAPSIEKNSLV